MPGNDKEAEVESIIARKRIVMYRTLSITEKIELAS